MRYFQRYNKSPFVKQLRWWDRTPLSKVNVLVEMRRTYFITMHARALHELYYEYLAKPDAARSENILGPGTKGLHARNVRLRFPYRSITTTLYFNS